MNPGVELIKEMDPEKVMAWDRIHDKRRVFRCDRCGAEWKCEYGANTFGTSHEYNGDPDILCQCCGFPTVKEVAMRGTDVTCGDLDCARSMAMEAEVIRKQLEDIMKNLFDTMIPKYINGHAIYGGYGVNFVCPTYINLDFGFGFEPNTGNRDITYYFSYAEGIPISGWLDTEKNREIFENRIREDISRRLIDMRAAIIKDDKENPIPYSIRRGASNLIMWDELLPDPKPIKYSKEDNHDNT